ncbi:MAG: preprotein translocase subunit YajC [Clostridia bacterium]|nr:preprotein translocase subunit YajC [Clostridia bacterium]
MLFLLNFFEGATTDPTFMQKYGMWIIMGVLIVGMLVFSFINNKKAKKRNEEKNSQLAEGVQVTTIGGIVGTIVKMDDQYLWIETGVAPNTMTMQILRQAIHSIGTPQNTGKQTASSQPAEQEDPDGEIK